MDFSTRISVRTTILIGIGLIAVQAFVLHLMERLTICACGFVKLWHTAINSSQDSQHLTDWYTFSHVIHGMLFYLALWYAFPKLPVRLRALLALALEIGWEILENTSFVINRYRSVTASLGYLGDSIINSIGDSLSMLFGFFLSYKLKVWWVVAIAVVFELFTLYMIRDNLTLNVVMLLFPFETLKNWQLGL